MLDKFLRDVVTIATGKQAEEIVELLHSSKHVNEFLLAKKLDITINQTRNILYKLADYGLVSSIRKKDKKKGWYTYFWKIEVSKSLNFLKDILIKRKSQIEEQIHNRNTKQFYICDTCHVEYNEETALLMDFTCNECGALFKLKDNTKLLKELQKNLIKIDKDLELIEEEINKEEEKLDKQRLKELKKEEKEKEKEKAAKKKATAEKKLAEKKLDQKKLVVKKKVVKKKAPAKKKPVSKKKVIKKKPVVKKKTAKKK